MKLSKLFSILTFTFIATLTFAQTNANQLTIQMLNAATTVENCEAINSENLEFSPAFYEDGLVFVSSRFEAAKEDENIDENFFELFYADIGPNNLPRRPSYFSSDLNSKLHEGPVAFNWNYSKIFFTRNNIMNGEVERGDQGNVNLQIFEAEKSSSDWTNLTKLPFNSEDYSCAHPSFSIDEQKLYFASDMPGGFGGMDLYVVEKMGTTWGSPQNLGAEINTTGNEIFPFIHESGILFFSSDGHGGSGGLDIFMIDLNKPVRDVLINLGVPFNSSWDDLGIVVNSEGTRGYFTSARAGGKGKDDVYKFETPEGMFGSNVLDAVITVIDQKTGLRLPNADIRIFAGAPDGFLEDSDLYDLELMPSEANPDELSLQMIRKREEFLPVPNLTTDATGEAKTQLKTGRHYIILVSKDGFKSQDVLHSTVNQADLQRIHISLQPQECVVLSGRIIEEISGVEVSGARIQMVNECDNSKEILFSNLDGTFYHCLPRNCTFKILVEKNGFEQGEIILSTYTDKNQLAAVITLKSIGETIANQSLQKGSVIIFDKIFYDFDKSSIRKGAARDLDALSLLMHRFPSMEIELIAHTDSRGSAQYNLDLSLARAESAEDYLVARGIEESRIKTFGFGESQLRNECDDNTECPELKHQYNRRTEIRVVEIDAPVTLKYKNEKPDVIDYPDNGK